MPPTRLLLALLVTWGACSSDGPPPMAADTDAHNRDAGMTVNTAAAPDTTGGADRLSSDTLPSKTADSGVLHYGLTLDLATHTGTAEIRFLRNTPAVFEVPGLQVSGVSGPAGPIDFEVANKQLTVAALPDGDPVTLSVDYAFSEVPAGSFTGLMASGSSLLWPYFCGNLYPCRPHPADGQTFSLHVSGLPPGEVAVYPETIGADVPAYTIALARGDYRWTPLGQTQGGIEVGFWATPAMADIATQGTADLVATLNWLETHIGPYRIGPKVGPVDVDWGPSAYGGMEHHPFWHVSRPAMGDPVVQAHEAVHGWFGTGLRLECWEDLVLSEGTADYLAARTVAAIHGPEAAAKLWTVYKGGLKLAFATTQHTVAWPRETCNQIDVLKDLFSQIPYKKGAYFYRELAAQIGVDTLDNILGLFYRLHANRAARMQDLLDLIVTETGFSPDALVQKWLTSPGLPEDL